MTSPSAEYKFAYVFIFNRIATDVEREPNVQPKYKKHIMMQSNGAATNNPSGFFVP
jgi:hypothetical protein